MSNSSTQPRIRSARSALRRRLPLRDDIRMVRPLLAMLRPYPWSVPVIVVFGVFAALAEGIGISLFIPLLETAEVDGSNVDTWWAQRLLSVFRNVPADQRILTIALCILLAVVARASLNYANMALLAWLDARISHRIRSGLFSQLLTVGFGYVERAGTGSLLNTLGTETWRTGDALGHAVRVIVTACTAAIYITILLMLSPTMTVGVGVAMLSLSLVIRVLTRRVKNLSEVATAANAILAERMIEGIGGMTVIRTFNRQRDEQRRFDAASARVSRVFMRLALLSRSVGPVHEVLSATLLVGVVLYILRGPGGLPTLLVFIFVLYRLQPSIQRLEDARTELLGSTGAVANVTGVLERSDKLYLRDGSDAAAAPTTEIRFEDVTFSYTDTDAPALRDASFVIPARGTTALVGTSGAGKSTIIKLLFRLYDPDAGTVSIDGRALPTLELASWRDHIALVSQDLYLFNASIHDNIAYGRPDATEDQVVRAAELGNAHEFITRLPMGFDTMVGDRGLRLSGGQRQRLALARAVIRDPQVLILDEATNALDSRSETLIQEAMGSFTRDRTVVTVAHRFSSINSADHVVALDAGRVCEQGSPQELLSTEGLFSSLHALQQGSQTR